MPIDKFLYDLQKPDFFPGPFAIRLKYEMKQVLFAAKQKQFHHLTYALAILCLSSICVMLIIKPSTAQSLNQLVFGADDYDTYDLLFSEENDIDLSNLPSNIRAVSTGANSSFPFIEEDKSYLVYKFKNHENKTLIYFSEVRKPQQAKTLH